MCQQSDKSVKQQYLLQNFDSLTAEIGWRVWSLQQSSMGFASWLRQTLCDVWPSPGLVHYFIHFRGYCGCKIHFASQVLRSPILAALLYSTRAAGVRQNLRRATRNRITELSQRTPPIFGWAAITLGIGPHYCSVCFILVMAALWNRACRYIFILWFVLLFSSFFVA